MTTHKSMIETAVEIVKRKRSPQKFDKIFKEVAEELAFNEEQMATKISDFYNDLSLSGVFVYMGDNEWDLKDRQPVELWEKDASFFIDPEELKARKAQRLAERAALRAKAEEAQKAAEAKQQELAEEKQAAAQEVVEDKVEEVPVEEVVEKPKTSEEEGVEITDAAEEMIDEEDYNKYMDEYEDLYEDE
jgi:DNA-directed RNA polymerase subunit delta